ncbi:pheromone A receptor-domain-containing protein [Aspergillus egyptiacus]|nr:pheromone A receptor-domain-containing protein [Aspergillus egyptiacus]
MVCWFLVLNLFNIVNAFIWPTDDIANWWDGAGLCDVEVKILTSSYVALPGTLVCLFRSLAYVLDTRRTTLVPSKRQRWRNRAVEILFCVVIPVVAAATHIVYQMNRYFIFAIAGCVATHDESWVSLVLGYMWPLVLCCIASYYCCLVLYRLQRYRREFNDILRSSNSGLSKSRFLRLFFLSFIMLLALIPIQSYMVWNNIYLGLPWHQYSWSELHDPAWHQIVMVPTNGEVLFDRWIPISAGFVLFVFFGCGRDASRMYRNFFQHLGLDCCFGPIQSTASGSSPQNTADSYGSRARLLLPWSRNQTTKNATYHSSKTDSADGSCKDLEKGTETHRDRVPEQSRKPTWLRAHLAWFGRPIAAISRHKRMISTPRLAVPANTVSTNAWAGSSLSRDSIDHDLMSAGTDFIRVKQVIRQEREMQV